MNTKQTPEQAAMEAMRKYSEWQNKHTITQYDSRQTIIKAFQDRERLLLALKGLIKSSAIAFLDLNNETQHILDNARDAIANVEDE